MSQRSKIIRARVFVRERAAPKPRMHVDVRPQHVRWEVGHYEEKLSFGPGGEGKKKEWKPDRVGEQHNLFLDAGYDLIATWGFEDITRYAAIGTGSTAPSTTDTSLVAELARTNTVPGGESDSLTLISDGVYDLKRVREFDAATVGNQNLTEWGWAPEATGTLAVRELFRDGGGNPTTITPAADQALRLIYITRITITPNTPTPASMTITGLGTFNGQAITHDRVYDGGSYYLYRATNQASKFAYGYNMGLAFSSSADATNLTYNIEGGRSTGDGNLLVFDPYVSGSRKRTASATLDAGKSVGTWPAMVLGQKVSSNDVLEWFCLVFDAGNELTKDSTHKIIFDPWDVITW